MSWRSSTSTPAVGSSRNRMRGSCDSALAISTRRFMPPESVMILASRLSQSDRSLQHLLDQGRIRLAEQPRLKVTVDQTVSNMRRSSAPAAPARSCARGAIVPHDVVAAGQHLCPSLVDDAADDADQRRLAGAVRAEQREDLAALDVEIDVLLTSRMDTATSGATSSLATSGAWVGMRGSGAREPGSYPLRDGADKTADDGSYIP
jgi:hypothetical protein